MKALFRFAFLMVLLSTGCNTGKNRYVSDWEFREGVDYFAWDFVACSDIDGGQYLVAPLEEEWTDDEKAFYHMGLNFWGEVTRLLWSAPLVNLYMDSGPNVYLQRVAEVLEGKHGGNPEVKEFGWKDKFTEDGVYNTVSFPPCDSVESPPNSYENPEAYGKWQKKMRRCLDIVFDLGDPCCFVVEKPLVRPTSGIVTLKLLESSESGIYAHLFARLELYFDRVGEQWHYAFRKVY
jgi:hypothetical protein